ncbi:MAG: CYTH and CHAD domain-containing protein [Pusillimonas sp.]
MTEREIKLHVPDSAKPEIARQLRAAKAKRITLQAKYFDTPNRELANAGIALRIRKEGRRWVQTVKAPGTDALSRIELNHLRSAPELDLALYTGTALEPLFAALKGPLCLRYETRVTRMVLPYEADGNSIEIAYDQGALFAGELELPISEVEFEYVAGDTARMFSLAREWAEKFSLVLDLRSKSERGDALANLALSTSTDANGQTVVTTVANPSLASLFRARRARPVAIKPRATTTEAYLACLNECLTQIIHNTAYAAGVDTHNANSSLHIEYTHQLRVGIRRLRSCLKLFAGTVPAINANDMAVLRNAFNMLGMARDGDVVALVVHPRLKLAGLPDIRMPRHAAKGPKASVVAANPELQATLVNLMAYMVQLGDQVHHIDGTVQAQPEAAKPVLVRKLADWLKRIGKKGSKFSELHIEAQHDLRKDVKALRYCLDFSETLLVKSNIAGIRKVLELVQEDLGELNDYYTAELFYEPLTAKQPQAWFAIGWLRAEQARKRLTSQALFRQLAKAGALKTR